MTRPDDDLDIQARLADQPTLEELRHVLAFLPEIYQDYIAYLTCSEEQTDGDCSTLRPRIDRTAGRE